MSISVLDVIVIGGGHAGLNMSYYLKRHGLKHLVFERGQIGASWMLQRWDLFKPNTVNSVNALPGFEWKSDDHNGFSTAQEFADMLKTSINYFRLPVIKNATVVSVKKLEARNILQVTVKEQTALINYYCRQVVIAS